VLVEEAGAAVAAETDRARACRDRRGEGGKEETGATTAQSEEQERRLVHPEARKKESRSSDALQRQCSRRAAGEQAGGTRRLTCVRSRTGAATNNTETKSEQGNAQTTGMSHCLSFVPAPGCLFPALRRSFVAARGRMFVPLGVRCVHLA
jgi:hypothetical protein